MFSLGIRFSYIEIVKDASECVVWSGDPEKLFQTPTYNIVAAEIIEMITKLRLPFFCLLFYYLLLDYIIFLYRQNYFQS